jgi:hypothetical protein
MRSAIYYPHTTIRSESIIRSSLLLWDKLHAIAPGDWYQPQYREGEVQLARAWELFGKHLVPTEPEKRLAHDIIAETLKDEVPPAFQWHDTRTDVYEVWPEKFAHETLRLLEERGLTGGPLLNGDFPFVPAAGVMVMSKLADAIAGQTFARVTDDLRAFALTPDPAAQVSNQSAHVIAMEVLDADAFTLEDLIRFREREQRERAGEQLTELRHAYLSAVEKHAKALGDARTPRQAEEMNAEFKVDMARDLERLISEITRNRVGLVLKPVVVGTAVAGLAAGVGLTYGAALAAMGVAAFGASLGDVADKLAKMFEAGYSFSAKQREAMAKHPMAYVYELKRQRQ